MMKLSGALLIASLALIVLYPSCRKDEVPYVTPIIDQDSIARDSLLGTYTGQMHREDVINSVLTLDSSWSDQVAVEMLPKDSFIVKTIWQGQRTSFRYKRSSGGVYTWSDIHQHFQATFGPADSLYLDFASYSVGGSGGGGTAYTYKGKKK